MAVMFICTLPLQVSSNLYNPHVFPENGPFFEGWYLRLQDPSKDFKMAVLFGTVLPQKVNAYYLLNRLYAKLSTL